MDMFVIFANDGVGVPSASKVGADERLGTRLALLGSKFAASSVVSRVGKRVAVGPKVDVGTSLS